MDTYVFIISGIQWLSVIGLFTWNIARIDAMKKELSDKIDKRCVIPPCIPLIALTKEVTEHRIHGNGEDK